MSELRSEFNEADRAHEGCDHPRRCKHPLVGELNPDIPEFDFNIRNPDTVPVARKLKASWSLEPIGDFLKAMGIGEDIDGVPYVYVQPIRWWQFWRWRAAWSEDYLLSRASELILIRKCRVEYMAQLERDRLEERARAQFIEEHRRDQAQ